MAIHATRRPRPSAMVRSLREARTHEQPERALGRPCERGNATEVPGPRDLRLLRLPRRQLRLPTAAAWPPTWATAHGGARRHPTGGGAPATDHGDRDMMDSH